MKKGIVVALALMLGTFAYAASLGIPWFVDSAPAGCGSPPNATGIVGVITLHNNLSSRMTCQIEYFTSVGDSVGPLSNNTFTISPKASIAFRPVVSDPASAGSGLESAEANKVPDRPMSTVPPNDNKKNGSISITWSGGSQDVQGTYTQTQTAAQATSSGNTTVLWKLCGYGHLLPPGS